MKSDDEVNGDRVEDISMIKKKNLKLVLDSLFQISIFVKIVTYFFLRVLETD